MPWRRVNITRDENIASPEDLMRHPNVRNYCKFPWGYTLFEFYDPIFECIYDADPVTSQAARKSEEIRERLATLMAEERKLLAPLYKGRPEHWQGNQFGLPLETVIYRVVDRKKTAWPWFGCSPDWEAMKRVKVSGRLTFATGEAQGSLEKIFDEWVKWAKSAGELTTAGSITFMDLNFGVMCEFSNPCGDPCMGLYLLLTKNRTQMNLEAVGFFDPDEKTPRFLEIGGTGVLA